MNIKHLPLQEAQKIAAGEVVERPANIIKELVENALDADATKITIVVEDGGKKSITITDNGNGMDEEDARICFLRHTTSKLSTFDELENILTFGFRGEALASICSVARITITTRHSTSDHGIALTVEHGAIAKEEIVGVPIGTTICISDLFYNVPARKKFLKPTATEWNQITQLFKALCVSNLAVHFVLVHNGAIAYTCPSTNSLEERIAHLFELSLSKQLFTFSHQDTTIECSGILTGTHYSRYDRNGMFIFVNKRWVKNYQLSQAIMKGYMNVLPAGKYPLVVLTVTLPTHEVDINTHPKKEEVAFLHPRIIEHCITNIIKTTLEQHVSHRLKQTKSSTFFEPRVSEEPKNTYSPYAYNPFRPVFKDVPLTFVESFTSNTAQNVSPVPHTDVEAFASPLPALTELITQESHIEETLTSYTILGQLHTTYLLLEHPDGLLLIDQHAAHERILYEKIATSFTQQETITLLFPETVSLQKDSLAELLEYLPLLEHHGIIVEQISDSECIVRAKPVYAQAINTHELLQQIIGWIHECGSAHKEQIFRSITEKMRAQIACKAAIKAGDSLSHEKMHALLTDLNNTTNRFSCPHGRPTSWLLPLLNIEKKFKRKL
jgi:DNA mismatch repair protein MutL